MAVLPASPLAAVGAQSGFARLRREWLRRRWGDLHRRLAAQPVFAACSRQEIFAIVRWGDEVTVGAGSVLWHEGAIGYHFVVVESGALTLMRDGQGVETLGPGDYAGDVAILGFGPQPATLTSDGRCRLFVLGRAALLSLVHTPGVRAGLFGPLDESEARARIRAMRDDGRAEWKRRFPPGSEAQAAAIPKSFHYFAPRAGAALPSWAPRVARGDAAASSRPVALTRRARAVVAVAVAAAVLIPVGAVATTARPRVGVVSASDPIDVGAAVAVTGAPTYPIHGRYVLTAVNVRRPTYAQWLLARLHHQTSATLAADQRAAMQESRDVFAAAKRTAIDVAAAVVSRRAADLRVTMQPLDIGGSSVSLVYALTLVDLLDPADLARGRTIAATGQLGADGRVGSVRFVDEKARVARAAGATLFLVPPGQRPRHASMRVVEVATLADALAALRAMNG